MPLKTDEATSSTPDEDLSDRVLDKATDALNHRLGFKVDFMADAPWGDETDRREVAHGIFKEALKGVQGTDRVYIDIRDGFRALALNDFGKPAEFPYMPDALNRIGDAQSALLDALGALQLEEKKGCETVQDDAIALCLAVFEHHRAAIEGTKHTFPYSAIDIEDEESTLRTTFLGAARVLLRTSGIEGMEILPTPGFYSKADDEYTNALLPDSKDAYLNLVDRLKNLDGAAADKVSQVELGVLTARLHVSIQRN